MVCTLPPIGPTDLRVDEVVKDHQWKRKLPIDIIIIDESSRAMAQLLRTLCDYFHSAAVQIRAENSHAGIDYQCYYENGLNTTSSVHIVSHLGSRADDSPTVPPAGSRSSSLG